jgi:hypothetical protein
VSRSSAASSNNNIVDKQSNLKTEAVVSPEMSLFTAWLRYSLELKMGALCCSETSVSLSQFPQVTALRLGTVCFETVCSGEVRCVCEHPVVDLAERQVRGAAGFIH